MEAPAGLCLAGVLKGIPPGKNVSTFPPKHRPQSFVSCPNCYSGGHLPLPSFIQIKQINLLSNNIIFWPSNIQLDLSSTYLV